MAGIAMHKAVGKYNEERERDGFQLIKIGIGLHLSDLMLGIIGTEERMQGTVIADAVNLTARLEGLCKIFGASIITSQLTLTHLKDPDRFKHRFVDRLRVRGRMEPVSVHEIYDGDSPLVVKLKEQTRESFEEGIRLYYNQRFSEASVNFNGVLENHPEDQAARIYLNRSAKYMVTGVPNDWTGVEIMT
jgi:two-component system sensor histidine kinase ChiS